MEKGTQEVSVKVRPRLAIDGGTPVREQFLPYHRPVMGPEEEAEVLDTLRSGWITSGPKAKKFEQEFAVYTGAPFAIALNSCTAALHLALNASGIGPGDEVVTSPFTFASTANVIEHVGAKPVFVDVTPDTLNLDPEQLEAAITPQTKAIVPVHFGGHPCDMVPILEIANRYGIPVIEDAAHAFGAAYRGRPIGTIGAATCFSFYATKNITTGEGGMLTTFDEHLAQRVSLLSSHGIDKDAWSRYAKDGSASYEIIYPGYKYNLSDLQASLGLSQLKKADQFWLAREEQFKFYSEALKGIAEIELPVVRQDVKSSYHLYVIQLRTELLNVDRDAFVKAMQAENIGVTVHFRAVHLHRYYAETYGFRRGMHPAAERASDRVMSIPLHPGLLQEDMLLVVEALKKVVECTRKSGIV